MKRSDLIRFVFENFFISHLSRISRFEFRVSPAVAQKCARPKSPGFKMRAAVQTAGQRGSKMRADAPGRTCLKSPIPVSSPKTRKSPRFPWILQDKDTRPLKHPFYGTVAENTMSDG